MKRELQVLAKGAFFEGPRWRDGRWWVSDFYRHAVFAVTPEGHSERVLSIEQQPSGIGWMPDGSMLVVSMKDRQLLRRSPTREVSVHADLSAYCGGPANDMVVDRHGRAFVGNFGFDLVGGGPAATASLLRVDPNGSVHVAVEGLFFPNGSVITPDGKTLIVGETLGNRYSAFAIQADGELTDRRVWAQFGPEPNLSRMPDALQQFVVLPDGCALDAEGQIWVADAGHSRCVRVSEGGKITDEIAAPPGMQIFACMLGGQDGRTLLLCAATSYLPTAEGALLTTQVDAPHAGLP
jgi:sugar lactone lactonase YvrE